MIWKRHEVELQVTKEQFQEVLARMREQDESIDALAAAVPLINEISRYGGEIISEMNTSLEIIAENIDAAIEERFKEVTALVKILGNRQNVMIQGLKLIQGYHIGETDILDDLRMMMICKNYCCSNGRHGVSYVYDTYL